MTTRKNDPDEQWNLLRSLAQTCDVLDPAYPDALVDEELRRAGGDPDAIGKRGAALVARLTSKKVAASTTRLRSQPKKTATSKPTNDPVQQWKTLLACCDDDLLDPDHPEALVDAELREAGLDPEEVGKSGEAFVKKLMAERAEAASRKASRTRLRSQGKASSSPPAKNLSSLPPMRAKAPSESDSQSEE